MREYITEDRKAATAAFNEGGIDDLRAYLEVKLDEWKSIPLNFGVIGNPGSGKSSFINTIRRLTADDKGAAPVGTKRPTTKPTPYPHRYKRMVTFWDLPGVGTPRFPRETYLEAIGFEKYDFFLILSSERFTQDDAWIGQEIVKKSKKFYFVRTKIGHDVENDKQAHPKTHNDEKVVQKIRENIQSNLKEMGVDAPVFLIDNYKPLKYDFGQLGPKLVEDLPQMKKEVMIHATYAYSADMVKKKIELLRTKAMIMAVKNALVDDLSVRRKSSVLEAGPIYVAIQSYAKTMGLYDKSLARLSATSGVSFAALRESADEHFDVTILIGIREFANALKSLPFSMADSAAEKVVTFLPVMEKIPAAVVPSQSTLFTLECILDQIEKASLAVIEKALAGRSE